MMGRFRQSMNWLHTWTGFAFAWLLYFIFITGSLGYFENEIDRWMKPELAVVSEPMDDFTVLSLAETKLEQQAEAASQWYISYPGERDPFIEISWLQNANPETGATRKWYEKNIEPTSGDIREVRVTSGGETLYRLHYNLHYVPVLVGYIITSLATLLMLIALITGVVIHKKIFIEFFTFRTKKGLRSWLDIHNIFSVLPFPFHLMITYSGLVLLMSVSMAPVIDTTFGEGRTKHREFYDLAQVEVTEKQVIAMPANALSLAAVLADAKARFSNAKISFLGIVDKQSASPHFEVWLEADEGIEFATLISYQQVDNHVEMTLQQGKAGSAAKVYDALEHLHEGLFANRYLRWLYFLCGLLGSGMIATGAIIWLKKRQTKPSRFYSIIERMNVAMFIGLPIAVSGYLLSNRLLPVELTNRAQWEMHSLFLVLLGCVVVSFIINKSKLWQLFLYLAALVFFVVPIVNMLTTDHSIARSFSHNDWIMLGVDLSLWFFALCFFVAAFVCTRKGRNQC